MINPLLCVLAESERLGECPHVALVKLMMLLQGHRGPTAALLAAGWDLANGAPDYPKMRVWATSFAADPDNAELMRAVLNQHRGALASLDEWQKEEVARTCPEAFRS